MPKQYFIHTHRETVWKVSSQQLYAYTILHIFSQRDSLTSGDWLISIAYAFSIQKSVLVKLENHIAKEQAYKLLERKRNTINSIALTSAAFSHKSLNICSSTFSASGFCTELIFSTGGCSRVSWASATKKKCSSILCNFISEYYAT